MKHTLYRITLIFILLTIVIVSFDTINRSSSFTTPLEALETTRSSLYDVQEIIETVYFDDYAYIFFYTSLQSRKDYVAGAKIRKGKYGWKQVNMFGVGYIANQQTNQPNTVQEGYSVGFAPTIAASVLVNEQLATLIELENSQKKLWFVHHIDATNELKINFLDTNGNPID
ncbi:hypothetical protein [Ornithinibacillus contaminans]|uniref:hypothetical protein n=1 Tax=Ornithinibacillus contaminans TaxID=694055 RepID=UPI00064E0B0C|nr:hypothetical protein [Ornithinibacillus contaminans]